MSIYNNCHYWNGSIYIEWWKTDDVTYRAEGPSLIYYDEDGYIERAIWHNNLGDKHRENGPAYIEYYGCEDNNKIIYEEWWENGLLNRYNGAAVIEYNTKGDIVEWEHYLEGIFLPAEIYYKILNVFVSKIKRYKQRKRKELYILLQNKNIISSPDICKLISYFAY